MAIDQAALLRWLEARQNHRGPVVHAIYKGLIERIRRGDFDVRRDRG